ncbi:MAG: 2-iminoacetate synthase ThiH [Candidatus Adiutrix sp.]|jgi:2-iminoacetate synthase|nr:2-iminoacetate synthase ThiH [Candidatus Adiutrix sp.]
MSQAGLIQRLQAAVAAFDFQAVSPRRVEAALAREHRTPEDLGALLSPAAAAYLEVMAAQAQAATSRFFGRNIVLYTPLYIANHCVNECAYCGYNLRNRIRRAKLTLEEIEAEARAIAATGLQDILLLTGESPAKADVAYIASAVEILRSWFACVGLEIYPLATADYARLHQAGADYISVYQETYDPALYDHVHRAGPKKDYARRFGAHDRALAAGFRGASFGSLLGLGPFRRDVLACGLHAWAVQEKYPQAEIGFSVPRLRPFPNQTQTEVDVHETELLQIMLALRLFMPWAGLSLSTRESPRFRDHALRLGVTRLSAGVCTGVGGHQGREKGDPQFHKDDGRSVAEISQVIRERGWQPVFHDHVRV